MKRVAYLGPEGTYSETAARQLYAGAKLLPCETFDAALAAVEQGEADACVLPIENSTQGSVHRVLDLLAKTGLTIQAELVLSIHHQLLGGAASLQAVAEVWAHPQALGQCRAWLAKNLPAAEQHAAHSNAAAAQLAVGNPHVAAIAGVAAAAYYKLHTLATDIEDDHRNTTRFVAVGTAATKPTGHDKTSLVCSLPNQAGSLYGLLGIFARHSVNLTKLESRPLPGAVWEYLFYIDCDGHSQDKAVAAALKEITQYAAHCKLLGSYRKGQKA